MRGRALRWLVWAAAGSALGASDESLPEQLSLARGGYVKRHARREYDHTCWMMGAFYNCKNDTRGGEKWWHVPDVRAATQRTPAPHPPGVTWRDILAQRGGHFAVAEKLRTECTAPGRLGRGPVNIVMVGSSFLRQVYEAISCRWRSQMTAGKMNTREPRMDKEWLRKFKHQAGSHTAADFDLYDFETGADGIVLEPTCHAGPFAAQLDGCYFGGLGVDTSKFFDCHDNMGMVELAGRVRFYFIFRARFNVGGIVPLLNKLGLNEDEVDLVLCNTGVLRRLNNASETACALRGASEPPGAVVVDVNALRATLMQQMRRDAGFLSTVNAFKVDQHACMPGLPDDEVDILFTMLLSTKKQLSTNGTADPRAYEWWSEKELYGDAKYGAEGSQLHSSYVTAILDW
ncbi:hypothetical protein M885DRAFT_573379 [Pelagophyceae sp. CCMP2097]|nr:hypothetical protein M885DRAFT_573379 [Pelagophyceae sp. CCMP2097]